jgi:hypothetical protein
MARVIWATACEDLTPTFFSGAEGDGEPLLPEPSITPLYLWSTPRVLLWSILSAEAAEISSSLFRVGDYGHQPVGAQGLDKKVEFCYERFN